MNVPHAGQPRSDCFKVVNAEEKNLSIDVAFRGEPYLRKSHLLQILELLATIYPEVRKICKLAHVIMMSEPDDSLMISEIKLPVMTSLGIKAVVQISEVCHDPFDEQKLDDLFRSHLKDYQNLGGSRSNSSG